MKKLFFLLALTIATVSANAQVSKLLGKWNTIDDKTGDQMVCVNVTEKDGAYDAVIVDIYGKDANGNYYIMKAPYPKEWEGVLGSKLFIDMKADGDVLRGKVYDPESKKTYYAKVSYDAKNDEIILRGSLDKRGILGRSQKWIRKK